MAGILRGDIYWASLNPAVGNKQAGLRPVLVLSRDVFNKHSGTVIAVALTSQPQKAAFPLTLELNNTKLSKKSWVKISQIRTLSNKRFSKKIGKASIEELGLIVEGLNEIITAG
ncbi:MAG: type II toxin-antitoxin system PemK/MazF family toxin [Proteobacteria bacterium]|nr:type II toxin-antitoxin system PemK/MazF family toxin [Pseudomonadota bacterium]MBU1716825.1 type II toxin-antitoxin system PemK/MazF family toxin [Pseudomonadota bacterium]